VDRPTDRRRRHARSANSVTVAELQAKSTPAEQAIVEAIQARAAAEADARISEHNQFTPDVARRPTVAPRPAATQIDSATEPLRPDDADGPRAANRLAKIIVATLVAMVACGAVAAGAALTGGPPSRRHPSAPTEQPAMLIGPVAIRPDVIIQQLTTGSIGEARTLPSGMPNPPPGEPVDGDRTIQIITDFYADAAVPERRSQAFDLLGPTMQTDGWPAFDGGWRGTRQATVNRSSIDEKNGSLLVWLSIERLDGSVLDLMQRFYVREVKAEGRLQPRIVGAYLLSAHRG